jgi:NAD(P)-dependent dehydrogenase (short-subunit alcohol dehydrogenase family)
VSYVARSAASNDVSSDGTSMPVAVVTGAGRARGIGRAICRRLSAMNYAVVVHERSTDPSARPRQEVVDGWCGAVSVADEITAAGGRATAVAGDVCDPETALAILEAASSLGQLAAVVNNHGSAGEANAHVAHETPPMLWDETFAVNVTSLHRLGAVLVPALIDSQAPHRCLVYLSSTAGHRALRRYGAYCASKAAVERLTEQQAIELARFGIRVNCVAPGLTPTDMIDGTLGRAAVATGSPVEQVMESAVRAIPLRRTATTDDIAAAIAFLVGDDASYITGQILTVDGGMTLV